MDSAPPSPWVVAHVPHIAPGGLVLDLAAGSGRHTHFLAASGYPVIALDRDVAALEQRTWPGKVEICRADLEDGSPWPLGGKRFAGIVVTNYLHRPLFPHLAESLAPGGILIYETFGLGNERFGRPSNPDFLLRPGELLGVAERAALTVLSYFCGTVGQPKPAVVQRLAAVSRP